MDKFIIVPTIRGINPIKPVLDFLEDKNAFVCGGYARYCASPNTGKRLVKAGDVDIYSYDASTFDLIKNHFVSHLNMEIRHENDMAVTFIKPKDKSHVFYGCPVLQLIKPVDEGAIVATGDMETILDNFDFTVIRCGIVKRDGKYMVMADEDFIKDEAKKFLRIVNIHCPISSMLRFMKYGRKGYNTRPSQVMKLFVDWDIRPFEYRQRLVFLFEEGGELGELTQAEIDELEKLLRID